MFLFDVVFIFYFKSLVGYITLPLYWDFNYWTKRNFSRTQLLDSDSIDGLHVIF